MDLFCLNRLLRNASKSDWVSYRYININVCMFHKRVVKRFLVIDCNILFFAFSLYFMLDFHVGFL